MLLMLQKKQQIETNLINGPRQRTIKTLGKGVLFKEKKIPNIFLSFNYNWKVLVETKHVNANFSLSCDTLKTFFFFFFLLHTLWGIDYKN